jgi:hypothetical protein
MNENEKKDIRLAALKAVKDKVKDAYDDASGDAKDEMLKLNDKYGVTQKALKIAGQKVGTVGVATKQPKIIINPEREAIALDALHDLGLTVETPAKGWEAQFAVVDGKVMNKRTGEVAEWAMVQPGNSYAVVRGCNFDDVNAALIALGTTPAQAALGDGTNA